MTLRKSKQTNKTCPKVSTTLRDLGLLSRDKVPPAMNDCGSHSELHLDSWPLGQGGPSTHRALYETQYILAIHMPSICPTLT